MKIFLIHHSHTDIGYTERQEVITKEHVNFIKQAIVISEKIHSGEKPEWKGFKWTCESFWCVEQFLNQATEEWKERFKAAILNGYIEITGNYLNSTELIDADVLSNVTKKSINYGKSIGVTLHSAMTADINGYSWGYANNLVDNGIENFFSCVHTHHGMYPLREKQRPFWWETTDGNKLLVWLGDHYHTGNVFSLARDPKEVYTPNGYRQDLFDENFDLMTQRIEEYMETLKITDYPYDFIPIMVSGLSTDNAPPNPYMMEYIQHWNKKYGDDITLELSTLQNFFDHVRSLDLDIPVYSGDWCDWWADGVCSTPGQTKLFRDAGRTLRAAKALDPDYHILDHTTVTEAEYNLAQYAEHTWGYSASIFEPWTTMVNVLGYRKDLYATNAHLLSFKCLDKILLGKGQNGFYVDRPLVYKVINPLPHTMDDVVRLYVDGSEVPLLDRGYQVICKETGQVVLNQLERVARGTEVVIPVSLQPFEEKTYTIEYDIPKAKKFDTYIKYYPLIPAEGIKDIQLNEHELEKATKIRINQSSVDTPYAHIEWKKDDGIISWYDKVNQVELLDKDRVYNAFTPVYEVTPTQMNGMAQCETRRLMGRNRKSIATERTAAKLVDMKVITHGELFAKIELVYNMPGTEFLSLLLTVYSTMPKVDVTVRMNKQSVWHPENLYVSLPFTTGFNDQMWIEKTGAILRPRVDQLPGTGTDFYCIQEGAAYISDSQGVAIGMPDTPLIHIGDIEYKETVLYDANHPIDDGEHLYSWVMNNFWETNFKASLAGFYEFNYYVYNGQDITTPKKAIDKCHSMNMKALCIRVDE